MSTIIVKTIGNGTRDYQTVQAWYNAIPDLVALDQIWIGELYKEGPGTNGEWTVNGSVLNASAKTTSATHYAELRPATGQGWKDGIGSGGWRYNPTYGVALRSTSAFDATFLVFAAVNLRLTGLQLKHTDNTVVAASGAVMVYRDCILECASTTLSSYVGRVIAPGDKFVNCLIKSSARGIEVYNGGGVISSCELVGTGVTGGLALFNGGGGSAVFTDNSFFGWDSNYSAATGFSGTNNATDKATIFGTAGLTSLTMANQFVSLTGGAEDYRLKSGNALEGAGVRDQANTFDLDAFGNGRSTTAPAIGAHEPLPTLAPNPPKIGLVTTTSTTIGFTATAAATGSATSGFRARARVIGATVWPAYVSKASGVFLFDPLTVATPYEFEVVAYNGIGNSTASEISIGTDNPATGGGGVLSTGIAITSPSSFSVAENNVVVGNLTAVTIPAGGSLAWAKTGGGDSALFSVHATTGQITYTGPPLPLNFEDPHGPNYVLPVQVTSGVNTASASIAITVTNALESISFTPPSGSVNTSQNVTVVDEGGNTVIGVVFSWDSTPTGSAGGTSNNSGVASVTFPSVAGPYQLRAAIGLLLFTAEVTVNPPIINALSISEPISFRAESVGVVNVKNNLGTNESGVTLSWQAASGGAFPSGAVTNAAGNVAILFGSSVGAYTLVATKGALTDTAPVIVTAAVPGAPQVVTIPSAPSRGVRYAQSFGVISGNLPISWAVVAGTFPSGLSLNQSTGFVSGVPTLSGLFSFTIKATNSQGEASALVSWTIPVITAIAIQEPLTGEVNGVTSVVVKDQLGRIIDPIVTAITTNEPSGYAIQSTLYHSANLGVFNVIASVLGFTDSAPITVGAESVGIPVPSIISVSVGSSPVSIVGAGIPGAIVDLRIDGSASFLMGVAAVDLDGRWEANIALPTGSRTIEPRQRLV
jgi:hypothetical protein